MQFLGYFIGGRIFYQGQITTATKISKVEIVPILRESHVFHMFRLDLPFMKKVRTYEIDCHLWVENPQRYVSGCITSRVVSGDSKEMCTVYLMPIFSSTSEEKYECSFTVSFEVTETSITHYKFVLLDPLRGENWESETIHKAAPVELLI